MDAPRRSKRRNEMSTCSAALLNRIRLFCADRLVLIGNAIVLARESDCPLASLIRIDSLEESFFTWKLRTRSDGESSDW